MTRNKMQRFHSPFAIHTSTNKLYNQCCQLDQVASQWNSITKYDYQENGKPQETDVVLKCPIHCNYSAAYIIRIKYMQHWNLYFLQIKVKAFNKYMYCQSQHLKMHRLELQLYSSHKQEIEAMNCRALSINKVEIYNQLLLKRTKQVTWLNKQQ